MKKTFLAFLVLLGAALSPPAAGAEKTLVCFPQIDSSYRNLNFQIKPSQGSCAKDEKLFELKRSPEGYFLFLPYEASTPASQPATGGILGRPNSAKPLSYY